MNMKLSGVISIGKDWRSGQPFIVSLKSSIDLEEELMKQISNELKLDMYDELPFKSYECIVSLNIMKVKLVQ